MEIPSQTYWMPAKVLLRESYKVIPHFLDDN